MNKRILKVALAVGLAAAVTCLLYLVIINNLGENPFGKRKYMAIGIYGVFFAIAMFWYRDKHNNNELGFRQGLMLGLLMNVIATALFVAMTYSYLSSTEGGEQAIEKYKAESIVLLDAMKKNRDDLSDEDYQTTLTNIKGFNAPSLALQQVSFYHGFGVFLTFLFIFIFKTPTSSPPKVAPTEEKKGVKKRK